MIKKNLLIIASTARPYAEAAVRSGFSVSVIDAFADEEVSFLTEEMIAVPIGELGFEAKQLLIAVEQLSLQNIYACLYGSGFEAQPTLLENLANTLPVHGNSSQVLQQVKNVDIFFSALDLFKIPHPKVFKNFPEPCDQTLLVKSITGCGGQHIRNIDEKTLLMSGEYLQEYVEREAISVLFLAENAEGENLAHIIGFNTQWAAPSQEQPFRFGGIASNTELTSACIIKLCKIVRQLSAHFQLVGLNSLDVVIKNEEIFVLEINPRLSASFELYAQDWLEIFAVDLLALHMICCSGQPLAWSVRKKLETLFEKNQPAKAMQIIYAEHDIYLSGAIDWPEWVKDRPAMTKIGQQKSINILKGNPICTVISQGNTALSAISAVKTRVNLIHHMMLQV